MTRPLTATEPMPPKGSTQKAQHLPGQASGWAVTACFGPGGIRWQEEGPCLRVVAVNPCRGTGSSADSRIDLLRRAVERLGRDGPCVYLTSAGFFGCAAPAG